MRARERQGGDAARSSAGCGPRWSGRTSGSPRSSSTPSCATGRRREAPRSGTASGLSNGPEEVALRDALPSELRPPFTLSLHTRLRWGERALLPDILIASRRDTRALGLSPRGVHLHV